MGAHGGFSSDNKEHKVSVAVLHLAGKFRHYAVPSLAPSAYLQCMTTNTSAYTLLKSKKVNLFLNNTFVGTSEMPPVSPGEMFRTMLGVDQTVKVEHRMVKCVTTDRGYFNKCKALQYRFNTRVKNTKSVPVHLILADVLPQSQLTAIRVKLVTPTAAEVDEGTKQEEKERDGTATEPIDAVAQVKTTNNLVWSKHVAAGETIDIPFEYVWLWRLPGRVRLTAWCVFLWRLQLCRYDIEHPPHESIDMYDIQRRQRQQVETDATIKMWW